MDVSKSHLTHFVSPLDPMVCVFAYMQDLNLSNLTGSSPLAPNSPALHNYAVAAFLAPPADASSDTTTFFTA